MHNTTDYVLIAHSILRWGVILFGLWAVISAVSGTMSKAAFTASSKKPGLFFMIFCDLQLVLGLVLYFKNSWFDGIKNYTSEVMKIPSARFFAMEHGLAMIVAWFLVHIGYSSVKKADTDAKKYKRALIFFTIAFVLILAMIPWPFRETGIARDWWPSM